MRPNLKIKFDKKWNQFKRLLEEDKIKKIKDGNFLNPKNPPFLAIQIKIPKILGKKIIKIQNELVQQNLDHRYYDETYFHITLKLIGWENDQPINEIIKRVEKISKKFMPFSVKLKGLNVFPTCAYFQVFDTNEDCFKIHESLCETLLGICKIDSVEGENYLPHVAILSFNSSTDKKYLETIEKYRTKDIGEFKVKEFHLVRAYPYKKTGVYEKIKTFSLKNNIY